MISQTDIQATCDDIVREFAPLQIILFGSYADGTPTEHSDVDLLVVMPIPKSETRQQELEIQRQVPHRFPMDLHVRSPEELAYRISYNDWFLREILEKGNVLYEAGGYLKDFLKITPEINQLHDKETAFVNPLTLEYIEKAEGDYADAKWLQQAPKPNYDNICFHAQQAIEKYLKAWLQETNRPVPRTHNVVALLNLIVPVLPAWDRWRDDFSQFIKHAVDSRYPGHFATATDTDAANAMRICTEVQQAVRALLMPRR